MALKQIKRLSLLYLLAISRVMASGQSGQRSQHEAGNEIDFISDTQQPMTVEKIRLRANHNIKATSLLLADILQQKPRAVYILGDVVAVGSRDHKWVAMDRFLGDCKKNDIPTYGLLGNHDVMWRRRKGEANFQRRFPDHVNTGYVQHHRFDGRHHAKFKFQEAVRC